MPEQILVIDVIVPPPPVVDVAALGVQGPPGVPGEDGEPGPPGPQGEPGPPGEGAGPHQASHAAGGADQIVGPLALGTNPAQSGAVRLANQAWIASRNGTNTADVNLIRFNATSGLVEIGSHACPTTNAALGLGSLFLKWARLFLSHEIAMTEQATPAAPAANMANLYLDDNGSGKTRLMVQFATGAAIQLAIQP